MNKHTPCDDGNCPYDATMMEQCRFYCGLGVDTDSVDEIEIDEEAAADDDND